ncbi:hypothetical protein AnigIFM56816_010478 [Aspergillus niger]|nr:hypothetical protein AnigIFM56816_010478 [Aspergillus niger]
MSATTNEVRAGFVVSVAKEHSQDGEPNVYTATQIPTVNSLPEGSPAIIESDPDFEFPFGPIKGC